jgi:hypothetical protein
MGAPRERPMLHCDWNGQNERRGNRGREGTSRMRSPVPAGRFQLVERGKPSGAARQFPGGTFLHDVASIQNNHPIGFDGAGEPMRDGQHGTPSSQHGVRRAVNQYPRPAIVWTRSIRGRRCVALRICRPSCRPPDCSSVASFATWSTVRNRPAASSCPARAPATPGKGNVWCARAAGRGRIGQLPRGGAIRPSTRRII